jgi:hypothetical protein
MDSSRFDTLVRTLGTTGSRRTVLRALGGVVLAALGVTPTGDAEARRRKKKCKHGLKRCGRRCVDRQTDGTNCGSCGTICGPCETCQFGTCRTTCPTCQECQNGTCGPVTDGTVCGACGACQQGHCDGQCTATEQCANGSCVAACDPACPSNQACVNGGCVDASGGCTTPDDSCAGDIVLCPADANSGASCYLDGSQPFCASSVTFQNDHSDACQTDDDCRTDQEVGPNARCVADCSRFGGGNVCVQFYLDPNG